VRERITLKGSNASVTLRFEDTAGLRSADDPVERMGIERSLRSAREADLVLLLVDPASPPEDVRAQWERLGKPARKTVGIFTKRDLFDAPHLASRQNEYRDLGIESWVESSAQTGAGIAPSIDRIADFCANLTRRDSGEVLLTRLDHLRCVEGALEQLARAEQAPEIELFAADIRQALHAMGTLIGETLADDILGKIFSEFCIGK
jgi:tRNA modification GTPase